MSREQHITTPSSALAVDNPSDDDFLLQINVRLHLDEIAEVEARELRHSARRQPTRRELCRLASRIYDARRARERIFDQNFFGEPAWDMLLALYCLPARGELLTASSLAYASAGKPTTAYRWQTTLEAQGLIERGPSALDARKQFMRLTPEGRVLLEKYLTRLYYCDMPVPPDAPAIGR